MSPSEAALQQKLANNPVYRAFENVHDVDDLYRLVLSFNSKNFLPRNNLKNDICRIADIWLNPAATASRAVSS